MAEKAIRGMLMGMRKELEVIELRNRKTMEGQIASRIRIRGEVWRIAEVYCNGD